MMNDRTVIRAYAPITWQTDIVVDIRRLLKDGTREFFNGEVFEKSERFQDSPACLHIEPSEAQELMDDLWRCGIRPTEGKGSAGQLSAVNEHLSDMRKIVAKKIGVEL